MILKSEALIVWIDDHFLTDEFNNDKSKFTWNKLFGKQSEKVFRHLKIKAKFLSTGNDAIAYIQNKDFVNSDTYFFFIVDRKLPYEKGQNAIDTASEDIVYLLQQKKKIASNVDYVMLSSSTADSYSIKNIDFYQKISNKDFSLPDLLMHKILLNIKNHIGLIDQSKIFTEKPLKLYQKKIENSSIIKIFPFIDSFKSFVEVEEIDKSDYSTLFVLTKQSMSDNFICQSLYISLFDQLKNFNGISYFHDDNYSNLKMTFSYEKILEETNVIPAIRLEEWDFESYRYLSNSLKYRLKVFIVNEEDENINQYLNISTKTRVIKINGIEQSSDEVTKSLLNMVLSSLINQKGISIKINSIYSNHLLLVHPILLRLIEDKTFKIEILDDPSEIISEIITYFNKLDLDQESSNNKNIDSINYSDPIIFDHEIYTRAKELLQDEYNEFIKRTIRYWLENSWNSPYNISLENINKDLQEKWQENTFYILEELFEQVDLNDNDKDLKIIKLSIDNFTKGCHESTKLVWPHEKFPMPSYMQKQLSNKNQKLYFQNKSLSFIDYSSELSNDYNKLQFKLNYYSHIFDLIEKTQNYFPVLLEKTIQKISSRIKNVENIFQENENEEFKKLGNVFIRIALVFGEMITNKSSNIDESDKGGLGSLVGFYRDNVITKDNFNLFKIEINSIDCLNSESEIEFLKKYGTILNNNQNIYGFISGTEEKYYVKNALKGLTLDDSDADIDVYNKRLLRADNIDLISQLSTLSNYLSIKEHELTLHKYKDGYKLLAYLADTRNMWEHKHNNLWNNELFQRFFIYSYETIWLMQKFILENLGITNLPTTQYVKLNITKSLEPKAIKFKTMDEYTNYFIKLYKDK